MRPVEHIFADANLTLMAEFLMSLEQAPHWRTLQYLWDELSRIQTKEANKISD
jgi:hypothetical protein